MEIITPCKVVGRSCMHRPHSGLSASSSCAPLRSSTSVCGILRSREISRQFSNFTVWEMFVARIALSTSLFITWNVLPPGPNVQNKRLQKSSKFPLKILRGRIRLTKGMWHQRTPHAAIAKLQGLDDLSTAINNVQYGECEAFDVGQMWEPLQARRFVEKRETIDGQDSHQNCTLSKPGTAFFAAISAQAYQPPGQIPERSQVSNFVTGGVLLSIGAWILWVIIKSEQYARKALVSPEETLVTPPPAPEMVEHYERAKASVAQAALVNEALAAVRTNDLINVGRDYGPEIMLMKEPSFSYLRDRQGDFEFVKDCAKPVLSHKCTVEMELALEENRLARTSIESDFFDEGELLQLYRGVLKMWLDGYPLDYGKILQLRGLLDIPTKEAEELEQEVQLQSDAYVI